MWKLLPFFEPKVVTISARNTILRKFAGGNRPLALMCRDEWSSRGHKQIDSFQTWMKPNVKKKECYLQIHERRMHFVQCVMKMDLIMKYNVHYSTTHVWCVNKYGKKTLDVFDGTNGLRCFKPKGIGVLQSSNICILSSPSYFLRSIRPPMQHRSTKR